MLSQVTEASVATKYIHEVSNIIISLKYFSRGKLFCKFLELSVRPVPNTNANLTNMGKYHKVFYKYQNKKKFTILQRRKLPL